MYDVEFKPETRRWMFWLAKIFGRHLKGNIYEWRGRIWVCGKLAEDDAMEGK